MHNIIIKVLFFSVIFIFFTNTSYACTAHNDQGDNCSTNCLPGQTEQCFNAPGNQPPSCTCVSSSDQDKSNKTDNQESNKSMEPTPTIH